MKIWNQAIDWESVWIPDGPSRGSGQRTIFIFHTVTRACLSLWFYFLALPSDPPLSYITTCMPHPWASASPPHSFCIHPSEGRLQWQRWGSSGLSTNRLTVLHVQSTSNFSIGLMGSLQRTTLVPVLILLGNLTASLCWHFPVRLEKN